MQAVLAVSDALPPLTPYGIMQLGKVKLLPVFLPGDPAMGGAGARGLDADQVAAVVKKCDAATVVGLPSTRTVEGSAIAIDASDGVVLNGSSNVTFTDFQTSNGIIHVIDSVLLPKS